MRIGSLKVNKQGADHPSSKDQSRKAQNNISFGVTPTSSLR